MTPRKPSQSTDAPRPSSEQQSGNIPPRDREIADDRDSMRRDVPDPQARPSQQRHPETHGVGITEALDGGAVQFDPPTRAGATTADQIANMESEGQTSESPEPPARSRVTK